MRREAGYRGMSRVFALLDTVFLCCNINREVRCITKSPDACRLSSAGRGCDSEGRIS